MRKGTASYGALAAAAALACGALAAQEREELSEAERAEIEQQTEQLRQRTEQLEQQTEELEQQTDELAEQNDARAEGRDASADQGDASTDQGDASAQRRELVQMAEETVDRLREQNDEAAALYESAYGYAVFDTTKGGLVVTGAGGTGVAMKKDGGERTFMHLGQAGVGLGAGLENYRLVLLIEDEQTYEDFVSGQWDGSISAQASAGDQGVSAEEQFVDGVRAYRLTDAGLMAQIDVSGVRFWPSEELNDLEVAQAEGAQAEGEAREAADDAGDRVEDAADEAEEAAEETEDALD